MKNYYEVIGVDPRAEPEAIKAAGRALALKYHPDRTGEGGNQRIRDVTEALEVLSDPRKRAQHDAQLINAPTFKRNPLIPYQVQADAAKGRRNLHLLRRSRFMGYIVLLPAAFVLHKAAIPFALASAVLVMCVLTGWRTLSDAAPRLRTWAQRWEVTAELAEALGQRPRALLAVHGAGALLVGPFAVVTVWWLAQRAVTRERQARQAAKLAKRNQRAAGQPPPGWSTT